MRPQVNKDFYEISWQNYIWSINFLEIMKNVTGQLVLPLGDGLLISALVFNNNCYNYFYNYLYMLFL